jgi:signal transduction histidine kinase
VRVRHLKGRPGLRARVTAAFAGGALVLSVVLTVVTFVWSRVHLLSERETAAAHQAASTAATLQPGLSAGQDPDTLVAALSVPADSTVLVMNGSRWASEPDGATPDLVPAPLRNRVLSGRADRTRYRPSDQPTLVAAGVPLSGGSGAVFVVVRLSQLDQALRTFATTLAAVAVATTLAGAAVGVWVGRLVLRPLRDAAAAAASIAGGRLDTRLPETSDRDLGVLAVSFNAMVDALGQRIARDTRFTSDVSHELRSPLTALSTSAQVLSTRRDALSERDQAALDVLVDQLARFQRLVEDLLEISRADADAVDLSVEEVQVVDLVTHAMAGSEPVVAVHVDPSVEDRRAMVDKRRIERVLANLVDNARIHGDGPVQVDLSAADSRIRICVDDAGPGVPDSERQRIFERFARGPGARRNHARGAGLGLSLVDEHVRLHGGTVWVESRPGGGARFVVELPSAN